MLVGFRSQSSSIPKYTDASNKLIYWSQIPSKFFCYHPEGNRITNNVTQTRVREKDWWRRERARSNTSRHSLHERIPACSLSLSPTYACQTWYVGCTYRQSRCPSNSTSTDPLKKHKLEHSRQSKSTWGVPSADYVVLFTRNSSNTWEEDSSSVVHVRTEKLGSNRRKHWLPVSTARGQEHGTNSSVHIREQHGCCAARGKAQDKRTAPVYGCLPWITRKPTLLTEANEITAMGPTAGSLDPGSWTR